jgi:hypothetical protein
VDRKINLGAGRVNIGVIAVKIVQFSPPIGRIAACENAKWLLAHDPVENVRVDLIQVGQFERQKSRILAPIPFGDASFHDGFSEGTANDLAVKSRHPAI